MKAQKFMKRGPSPTTRGLSELLGEMELIARQLEDFTGEDISRKWAIETFRVLVTRYSPVMAAPVTKPKKKRGPQPDKAVAVARARIRDEVAGIKVSETAKRLGLPEIGLTERYVLKAVAKHRLAAQLLGRLDDSDRCRIVHLRVKQARKHK